MADAAPVIVQAIPPRHRDTALSLVLLMGTGYLAYRYVSGQGLLPSAVPGAVTDLAIDAGNAVDAVTGSLTSPTSLPAEPQIPNGAPLGIRNKNPGNITPSLIPFQGTAGTNGGKVVFSNAVYGLRAIMKLLRSYGSLHGLHTISQIAHRWTATDEAAWRSNVAMFSGIAQEKPLDLTNFQVMASVVRGIIGAENGQGFLDFYPASLYQAAWNML